jgi:hypothetical protein
LHNAKEEQKTVNDETNPGVLKMLGMGSDEKTNGLFPKNKIVRSLFLGEYDPTDALKMPQLMAEANNEVYVRKRRFHDDS